MGKPVIFETPAGEKMVVLSLAEYETLVAGMDPEDAADVAAFDEAMAKLQSGDDRPLSPRAMAAYTSRPGFLRGLRRGKGLTQIELAGLAGITQGYLSDIEAGRRKASAETIERITRVLDEASQRE